MTNQCNLRCTYCDWKKDKYVPVKEREIANVRRNLNAVRKTMEENYPEVCLIEYSGGEPLVHPEIINELLKTFPDKWIRIITNGVAVNDEVLSAIAAHGKTYLSISLDGHLLEANYARFQNNEKLFQQVLDNIDKTVKKKIPITILCTLNQYNIDYFEDYVNFLQNKYDNEIRQGMFVMAAHYVTSYDKDNGLPSREQVDKFIDFVENRGMKLPIIKNAETHYRSLMHFAENREKLYPCRINQWNISMHFRKNEIIENGRFLSFGCGMRGVMENGTFCVNDKQDIEKLNSIVLSDSYLERFDKLYANAADGTIDEVTGQVVDSCCKKCFVDWSYIDYILNGVVDYNTAENWFVMFKDEKVKNFVQEYLKK